MAMMMCEKWPPFNTYQNCVKSILSCEEQDSKAVKCEAEMEREEENSDHFDEEAILPYIPVALMLKRLHWSMWPSHTYKNVPCEKELFQQSL